MFAMVEVVAQKGYNATTIADIVSGAGVSRATFYQLFEDKLTCFIEANKIASQMMIGTLESAIVAISDVDGIDAQARMNLLVERYLESISIFAEYAKVFLVEVFSAGPDAIALRLELMNKFVDLVVESGWNKDLPNVDQAQFRSFIDVIVSALSLKVTTAVGVGDMSSLDSFKHSMAVLIAQLIDNTHPA